MKATLRHIDETVGIRWLLHQPSHSFDDVSTPGCDRALVIVIPSHILESESFPLRESMIIRHASHGLPEAIPISENWQTQSVVCFLQQVVIVCPHALPLMSHTGYICTRHRSQKGNRDYFRGLSQGIPERQVPMPQQCNRSA